MKKIITLVLLVTIVMVPALSLAAPNDIVGGGARVSADGIVEKFLIREDGTEILDRMRWTNTTGPNGESVSHNSEWRTATPGDDRYAFCETRAVDRNLMGIYHYSRARTLVLGTVRHDSGQVYSSNANPANSSASTQSKGTIMRSKWDQYTMTGNWGDVW